ncbi:DUF3179 domain-containing protein [Gracilimonas sp.]|uniref:DUF3179 domain-containing protein n=1 Tax=Gracilimonas sp. TaxID=1974203 RepID=UPI0028713052|nr:DUF3179 domain-containing protein [Gracilimonas sp.]
MKYISYNSVLTALFLVVMVCSLNNANGQEFRDWETNFTKKSIDLNSLKSGGPPKDGIPAINNPKFVSFEEADSWLNAEEPVIAFQLNGTSRAYPLQILIWHEIVNDQIEDTPVLVTFCPLCYSAIVFDRRIDGNTHNFGVSGFLRHSDMIMFDRKTESLWQQFTGEALVGDYTGTKLKILPSQLMSFEQFREAYPEGSVLSKETGHNRPYGKNPYVGYDDINNTPLFMDEPEDDRLKPMQKVVGVRVDDQQKAYPFSITQDQKIIHDEIDNKPIVVFHTDGARSAMDASKISQSRKDGTTGAFDRMVNDQTLTFSYYDGNITDDQTGSKWNISGMAIDGPLEGQQLEQLIFGDYFAFAWLVFWPETEIYTQ